MMMINLTITASKRLKLFMTKNIWTHFNKGKTYRYLNLFENICLPSFQELVPGSRRRLRKRASRRDEGEGVGLSVGGGPCVGSREPCMASGELSVAGRGPVGFVVLTGFRGEQSSAILSGLLLWRWWWVVRVGVAGERDAGGEGCWPVPSE